MGKHLMVAKIPLNTVWTNTGVHTWRILVCIPVILLMLVSTLPQVNYFSTLLAGKEDKSFDLTVGGILFLSYSLVELGSIYFKCCHPGLTRVLGNRMLGGMNRSWCPKAQWQPQNTQVWGCPVAWREQWPVPCKQSRFRLWFAAVRNKITDFLQSKLLCWCSQELG